MGKRSFSAESPGQLESRAPCESEALMVPAFLHFLFFPSPSLFQLRLQKALGFWKPFPPFCIPGSQGPLGSSLLLVWKPQDFNFLFPSVLFQPAGRHVFFIWGTHTLLPSPQWAYCLSETESILLGEWVPGQAGSKVWLRRREETLDNNNIAYSNEKVELAPSGSVHSLLLGCFDPAGIKSVTVETSLPITILSHRRKHKHTHTHALSNLGPPELWPRALNVICSADWSLWWKWGYILSLHRAPPLFFPLAITFLLAAGLRGGLLWCLGQN